jgi:hypothetical protein
MADRVLAERGSPAARRDEGAPSAAEAGWVVGPSGEYWTYSTDHGERFELDPEVR